MNPTPSDVHVNTPLTNISIAMLQSASAFVAARVFPNVPVSKQSDRYYVYDRGEFNRDEMTIRAPGTESSGGGYAVDSTPTYYCDRWSFHKDISDEQRQNADAALNPDREATEYVTHKALIRREKVFVSRFFVPGVWGTNIAGVPSAPGANQVLQWNDVNSNPIEDVRRWKTLVLQSTGFEPNKLVIGRQVYDVLVDHPDIIDRVKYGQTAGGPASANLDALRNLLEIPEIYVMNAIENTGREGAANSHAFIGGRRALLCYAPQTPGLMTPSAGYTFSWTGMSGNGVEGNRIRTFRMEHLSSDRIEIDMCFDMRRIAADLGLLADTIIA